MVALPATIWRPTSGLGESGQSDGSLLTTQNSNNITTQSGLELQIENSSYTRLAATVWVESEGE